MPAPCPIIILRHPCRDQRANRGRGAGADWSVVRHRACGHRSLAARTRAHSPKRGASRHRRPCGVLCSLALSRSYSLTRYLDDGRLEISNNSAERAIGPLVLGRKNYLFAGSDAGGERAAAAHTLIETAKLNEVDPEAYLREVLGGIADHPINRIRELLP
jgi:hypothetical protein